MNTAIILASGKGRRIKKQKNKVLLKLKQKPIVVYSLEIFQKVEEIDQIVLVCKGKEIEEVGQIVKNFKIKKVTKILQGGHTRQKSCLNALKYLLEFDQDQEGKEDIVVIHNAANPFVTEKEIISCVENAIKTGACVVAHKVRDTIKVISKQSFVKKTLNRGFLVSAQTPQAMTIGVAKEALAKATRFNLKVTDDVSLVEKIGRRVKVLPASKFNIKISTPLDFELAKIIIEKNLR